MSSRDVSGYSGSQPGDGWDRIQARPDRPGPRDAARGYRPDPRPGAGSPADAESYAGRRRRDDGYPQQRTAGDPPRRPRLVLHEDQAQLAGERPRTAGDRYEPHRAAPRPDRGPASQATQNFSGPGRDGYRPARPVAQPAGYGRGSQRPGPAGHGPGGRGPGGSHGGGRGGGSGGTGTGPRPVKVQGSWWRRWTWKKAAGVSVAGLGVLILLAVAGVSYAYATTTVPTDASQAATQQQSTVYFSDGKTVAGTLGTTDRQLLAYNQISPYMRAAVVAAEDRSFYTGGGVSPRGIVRAAYEDVFNSGGSNGSLQGGSTITQEFVRNYYANIGTQQTATRKMREIFVALKVAKEKSKAWILTNYLNTIYLGDGAYG
ncbi:MAG TPA: transglycosylase domain-containing protein, partial [Streptosporangiaceae bacterium]